MEKKERRKYFWNSASLGGLIMGGVLALGVVLTYATKNEMTWITNVSIVGAFVGVGYVVGKRFEKGMSPEPLSYGRALAFELSMLMFAGVIYGVTTYIMYTSDPAFYRSLQLEQLMAAGSSKSMIDLASESFDILLKNPVMTIISSIFTMIIYGLFPSLITAALIRTRKPINR